MAGIFTSHWLKNRTTGKTRFSIVFILFTLISLGALAEESSCNSKELLASRIKPYETTYAATFRGVTIDNRRVLKEEPDQTYLVSGEMSILFVGIREFTRFRVRDARYIQPVEYLYERDGLGDKKDYHIAFDWNAMKVNSLYKDRPWTREIPANTQDMLSQQEQFRLELLCDPQVQEVYEFPITKKKRNTLYRYAPLGEEVLQTPLGKLNTLKFHKVEETPGRETVIWLAKDWDYLIAQLTYQEDDDPAQRVTLKEGTLNGIHITGLR